MEMIKTFYWNDQIITRPHLTFRRCFKLSPSRFFSIGNAGDIVAREIIRFAYNMPCLNIKEGDSRFFCVGSVVHKTNSGDVICGAGVKDADLIPKNMGDCKIYGLRGPLSYQVLSKAGFDLSAVKFLLDPGLLIRFMIQNTSLEAKKIIFIPHYRERYNYIGKLPKEIELIDIDDHPLSIAKAILSARLVYSSSLHGIIFSHALDRSCIFVKPQTEEPLFKFQDYYLSVGLPMPEPLNSIESRNFMRDSDTPPGLKYGKEQFYFPPLDELRSLKVCQDLRMATRFSFISVRRNR